MLPLPHTYHVAIIPRTLYYSAHLFGANSGSPQ